MLPKIEIVVFIDALGWEIAQKHSFLQQELPFRQRIEMQFGYSCTALPTILSGCRPNEHGHLCLFYYDPVNSPFKALRYLHWLLRPRSFWNRGRVRNILSRIIRRLYRYDGYFQLYQMPLDRIGMMNYCEKQDIFAPKGLSPLPNLQDTLMQSRLKYHLSDWRASEQENIAAAAAAIQSEEADFLFIYLAGLDSLLHEKIGEPELIQEKLQFYEQQLRHLLQLAQEHADSFSLTVISDHGMTPLRGTADIKGAVEELGLRFGVDYAACYDATMFRVYFLTDAAREIIMNRVTSQNFPGHWLSQEEKQRYGIETGSGQPNYGDEIFLLAPGVQIVPSDMGDKPLPGMHGFAPEDQDSAAVLLSTDPLPEDIREVADLFSFMKTRIAALDELHWRNGPA
ncbi:MAG: alkaline phosphatase family protein [Lentisphaerae bacterium]|jgi:hypothetical protein|nr:alkaline phosphatase family protein [Lentisphaerota bacterium]